MKQRLIWLLLVLICVSAFAAEAKTYRKSSRHKVELYVTSWCPYCKKAEAYLDSRGIEYRLYDIEKDAAAAGRKQRLAPNRGVPVAIIDGTVINGWSQQVYESVLEK